MGLFFTSRAHHFCVCRSHSSSLLHLWLSYLWWTARLSSTRERIWLRWATCTAVNKHTFISCLYKWYNLCALGGARDVLGISWVWRFRAAVHGQVPVSSWLFLGTFLCSFAIFGKYKHRDICGKVVKKRGIIIQKLCHSWLQWCQFLPSFPRCVLSINYLHLSSF